MPYRPEPRLAMDRATHRVKGMAFDRLAMDGATVRSKDIDGRLHLSVTNISKASVDPYYGEEIPDWKTLGLDPRKIYQLLRAPEELDAAKATFNNLPILDEHIPVSADDPQKEHHIGTTGTDAEFNNPYLQNSAVVDVQTAIDDIEEERKKEWSCGYYYTPDMTPGTFQGLHYDGVMRNIAGNHVALVDAGRAGPDVMVGDEMPRGLVSMAKIMSRAALMLNGALAAAIAPKLAMDKKLDLSGALSGVTAANMGKNPAKLAGKIVAATKGLLAQDEKVDADDVVKLIGAITGATPEMSEDEDEIPEQEDIAEDEDETEEEKAERLAKEAAQAKDDEPCAPPGGKKPGAMDAKAVSRILGELRVAEREVAPLIGEVKVTCDSAAAVYKLALDHAKVDIAGVHPSAYRAMVGMLAKTAGKAPAPIAMDRATVYDDFMTRFPEAKRCAAN